MALGARRDHVLWLVFAEGLTLVTLGLAIGVVAATALTRALSAYLFDTRPTDPATFAAVGLTFIVVGLLACLGPAWRATNADPISALRAE